MTTYLTKVDALGRVGVRSETNGIVSRKVIAPGAFTDAVTFVATDISGEAPEVQAACTAAWTPEVVAAFKAAFPYVAPYVDPDAPRKAQLAADVDYLTMLQQAKSATPAQINSWLTTNVTTLGQARTVLGALIKYVALRS